MPGQINLKFLVAALFARTATKNINATWYRRLWTGNKHDVSISQKNKPSWTSQLGFPSYKSLTMSYFHTGIRTIIGAKSFHCPVRDGKEWYQLAMVIRHNCFDRLSMGQPVEFIEQISFNLDGCAPFCGASFWMRQLGITALNGSFETVKVIGSILTSN